MSINIWFNRVGAGFNAWVFCYFSVSIQWRPPRIFVNINEWTWERGRFTG